jgi:hypothetical protein
MSTKYLRRDGTAAAPEEAMHNGVLRDGYSAAVGIQFADTRSVPFATDRITLRDLGTLGELPAAVPKSLHPDLEPLAKAIPQVSNRRAAEELMHALKLEHTRISSRMATERMNIGRFDQSYAQTLEAAWPGMEAALSWIVTVHQVLEGSTKAFRDADLEVAQAQRDAAYDAGRDYLRDAWRGEGR